MTPKKTLPVDAYRKTEVLTASRESILLMLYSGAIRFIRLAIDASDKKDLPSKAKYTTKAQDIVNELRATLNFEVGQEISNNLERLYLFASRCLVQSTLDKSSAPLHEALKVLETLSKAWEEAIDNLKKA